MTHEDSVREAIATKLMIRTRKRIWNETSHLSLQQKMNLAITLRHVIDFGGKVFQFRPEFYASIVILATVISDMVDEVENMKSKKTIYL